MSLYPQSCFTIWQMSKCYITGHKTTCTLHSNIPQTTKMCYRDYVHNQCKHKAKWYSSWKRGKTFAPNTVACEAWLSHPNWVNMRHGDTCGGIKDRLISVALTPWPCSRCVVGGMDPPSKWKFWKKFPWWCLIGARIGFKMECEG